MYCPSCGKRINAAYTFCPFCGSKTDQVGSSGSTHSVYTSGHVKNDQQYQYYDQPLDRQLTNDTGSIGWGVLGFFFPLVGLILFLVWNSEKPKNAKSAGMGALINLVMSVGFAIIISLFGFLML